MVTPLIHTLPIQDCVFHTIQIQNAIGKAFANQFFRQVFIVFIKKRKLLRINQFQWIYGFPDFFLYDPVEICFGNLHGKLHIVRPRGIEVFQPKTISAFDLQKPLHCQEGICSHPGKQAPHIAAKIDQRSVSGSGMRGCIPGLVQPGNGILHQIGIGSVFLENLAHPLQNLGMQVSGTFSEVSWDAALDLLTVNQVPFVIHIQNQPYMSCNGQFFTHRRGQAYSTKLLGFTANGIFFTFYENTIELEGIDHPFTGKTYDQAALFRLLDVICFDQMP